MLRLTLLSILSLLILTGCNSDSSNSNSLQRVSINNGASTYGANQRISIHNEIQVDDNSSSYELKYYLVSSEAKEEIEGDIENNSTTISTPLHQHLLTHTKQRFKNTHNILDINATVPSDIVAGEYYLVASLEKTDRLHYSKSFSNTIFSEDVYYIDPSYSSSDIKLLDLHVDEDVLIVDTHESAEYISATLELHSVDSVVESANIEACLMFESNCYPLYFENEESLEKEIRDINLHSMHISMMMHLSSSDKVALYEAMQSGMNEATLNIEVNAQSNSDESNNKLEVALTLFKYQHTTSRGLSDAQVSLKSFDKGFSVSKKDSRFGIELSANADAEFGSRYSDANVIGGLSVRIMGKDIVFLGVDTSAKVQYDSFEETGYSILVKALGKNVLNSSKTIAQLATMMHPFFKTSKQRFLIPPHYDTSGSSFTPLESKLFSA